MGLEPHTVVGGVGIDPLAFDRVGVRADVDSAWLGADGADVVRSSATSSTSISSGSGDCEEANLLNQSAIETNEYQRPHI